MNGYELTTRPGPATTWPPAPITSISSSSWPVGAARSGRGPTSSSPGPAAGPGGSGVLGMSAGDVPTLQRFAGEQHPGRRLRRRHQRHDRGCGTARSTPRSRTSPPPATTSRRPEFRDEPGARRPARRVRILRHLHPEGRSVRLRDAIDCLDRPADRFRRPPRRSTRNTGSGTTPRRSSRLINIPKSFPRRGSARGRAVLRPRPCSGRFGPNLLLAASLTTIILSCTAMPLAMTLGLMVAIGRVYGPPSEPVPAAGGVRGGGPRDAPDPPALRPVLPPARGSVSDAHPVGCGRGGPGDQLFGVRGGDLPGRAPGDPPKGQMEAALALGMSRAHGDPPGRSSRRRSGS